MEINTTELLEIKRKWLRNGFLGGAILCNFIVMNEMGLDIVFDSDNKLVQEYIHLLQERLETDSYHLVLMVSVEIENCYIDKEENVYPYLADEIYEHFKNNNMEYPVQAIGLHVDVQSALISLNEEEKAGAYLFELKRTYKMIFGRNSYLFCKSWCHILDEVLLDVIPEVAIEEFLGFVDLFSATLKEDMILYKLCLDIAIKRTNQEQKTNYIKDAIDLCQSWYTSVPIKKQREIRFMLQGVEAMYYRNIGKYDIAIPKMEEIISFTDDIHYKLFLLAQIASMLYAKYDMIRLGDFFQKNKRMMQIFQEPEESIAELYNIYGIYYKEMGDYYEANTQMNKAIALGEKIWGKKADETIKFICNKLMIQYSSGEFDEAVLKMQEMCDLVSDNPEKYPQSLPLILNNMIAMSFEEGVNSDTTYRLRCALDNNHIKYDMASNIILKCNIYHNMMSLQSGQSEGDVDALREELSLYFEQNPYANGFFQYLEGEICRAYQKGDSCLEYSILGKMEDFFSKVKFKVYSHENITYFIVRVKKFIYDKNYIEAKKLLFSMWGNIIFPMFEKLGDSKGKSENSLCRILHYYISLFISVALQYPQLKVTDVELFEYVLNFKYLEDLFYCNKIKFDIFLKKRKWISIERINISKEKLIIECFNYTRVDMEDTRVLFGDTSNGFMFSVFQICFGIQTRLIFSSKCSVGIISDSSYMEVAKDMSKIFDTEEISTFEKLAWNKLKKFLVKKEKIYVCTDVLTVQIPLAAMKINKKEYIGERFQVIYCNTSMDVKDDIEIRNFSNSIYFGMSLFDDDRKEKEKGLKEQFSDLPFAELEIRKLSDLTGGKMYLDRNIPKQWFIRQKMEIICFSTHTTKGKKDGRTQLIVGKNNNGQYIFLGDEEISKFDWGDTKLVIFAACEAAEETGEGFGRQSLSQTIKKTGALFCISAITEIEDGVNSFFEVCFFKKLLRYKKISKAFFETQKTMCRITKKEILSDSDYLDIYMDEYLCDYGDEDVPFESVDDWAGYLLQMN